MSNTNNNQHRRAEDVSWSAWIRDKILPPLLVAFIMASTVGGMATYKKIDTVANNIATQEIRLKKLESDVIVLRSQMVGWDVIKRIEQGLQIAIMTGNTDKATAAIAASLKNELEARKESHKSAEY